MAGWCQRAARATAPASHRRRHLRQAAAEAAHEGLDLLIEPINTRDIPGFFLNRQDQAHELIAEIGAANLKVQMDLYHCQVVEGDLAMKIRQYLPTGRVGHFQIAGVPRRYEPDRRITILSVQGDRRVSRLRLEGWSVRMVSRGASGRDFGRADQGWRSSRMTAALEEKHAHVFEFAASRAPDASEQAVLFSADHPRAPDQGGPPPDSAPSVFKAELLRACRGRAIGKDSCRSQRDVTAWSITTTVRSGWGRCGR
jgi:hypothetical protein